jgi:hypothetical protein
VNATWLLTGAAVLRHLRAQHATSRVADQKCRVA